MAYDRTATNTSSNCEIAAEAVHATKQPWHPLSAGQLSPWFHYRVAPESQGAHNPGMCMRVRGTLDCTHLASALRTLIARHPMLTAEFSEIDGQPVQRVRPDAVPEIVRIDARSFTTEQLIKAVDETMRTAFDLHAPPHMRVCIYDTGPDEAALLLAFDHIVCDGWSFWLLLEELGELLSEPAGVAPANQTNDVTVQYFDYIEVQRQALAGAKGEQQWDYWRHQLKNLPALDLPVDRPQRPSVGYRGGTLIFMLDPALTAQVKQLSAANAGSAFSTLLAAFQVLLHRISGQDEVVIGTVMPARGTGEWDRVVGQFINPVVLRADLSNEPTVRAVLRATRNTAMLALKNQDFPFSTLVQRLGLARDSNRHPMFQVMYNFQKARHGQDLLTLWAGDESAPPVRWGGLDLTTFPSADSDGLFDLTLEVMDLGDRIRAGLKYNADLFDAATVERMASNFTTLLAAMV
ncbi:condensation domain-containing protein, partial [Caenimonas sp. SL110]|uniref:condensation domain-containing protein n=1 Tax=Caenimonas sp. SL110 TaxID=1450524 RepID=UPI00065336DC